MGKLIDHLERLQKVTGPRIGFGTSNDRNRRSVAIVTILDSANAKLAGAAVTAGTDAILVTGDNPPNVPLAEALGVGNAVSVGSSSRPDTGGVDFTVVAMSDQVLGTVESRDIDTVLELESDASEDVFRTLEGLPAAAFVTPQPVAPLTYSGLITLYRVVRATNKPVLTPVGSNADEVLLRTLRDAGVIGLLVKVNSAADAKALGRIRETLDTLGPIKQSNRPRSRPVSVGLTTSYSETAADDEFDEEE